MIPACGLTDAMYIRFGDLPEAGCSRNADTDAPEAGVSCYRASWQSSDRDVICVHVPSDACIGTLNQIQDRPVYIVTGDLLAVRGGDGEPLMANAVATLHGPVEVVNYVIEEQEQW